MKSSNQVIVDRVKTLYKEYQLYAKHFEKEKDSVEQKKKDIAKALQEDYAFEKHEKELEWLLFGYQMKVQDINNIVSELVSVYKLAVTAELTEEFDEEINTTVTKLKDHKKKQTFIPTEKGLEERVAGTQKEGVDNIKNSPNYNGIMKMLEENLQD